MKKTIKIIALCLCLTLFGVLFAGCDMLDEAKATHAILSDDRNTITFRGETYKKLPHGAELYTSDIYGDKFENIAVTDDDVPVLVADMYSHTNQYDEVKDIFLLYGSYSEVYDTEYSAFTYYCNEKDYDKYVNVIENGVLDRIGFEYETYDNNRENFYYTLEAASESLSNEIFGHMKNPEKMTNKTYNEIYNAQYVCLQFGMSKCEYEGILAEAINGYDIFGYNGEAYLIDYSAEVAVKLSKEASSEIKSEYFYGDYGKDFDYSDDYNEDDAYVGIIGGADGDTAVFVG